MSVVAVLAVVLAASGVPKDAFVHELGTSRTDEHTRLVVQSQADGPVVVGVDDLQCAVVLPRAPWRLWREGAAVRGNADLLNLTVTSERSSESPRAVLERESKELRARFGDAVVRSEIVPGKKGGEVLVVVTDAARASREASFKGVRMFAMFGAKQQRGRMFIVHLSAVVGRGAALPDEADWRKMLTIGIMPFDD